MAANFINVENLNYCGKEAQKIFSEDVYGLDLRSYGITFMDGVKGKTKVYDGTIGDVWQEYSCPFSPKGEVVLGEAYIEPAEIKVNLEECYDKFWNTFLVEQTEISLKGGIPATFANWFFAKLRGKMNAEYQEIFWKGDKAAGAKDYLKVIDGVEKQLNDAEGVNKINGAALTLDNVIAQVEAAVMGGLAKAAENDVPTDNYKIFMNYADVKLLEVALGKLCCGISKDAIFGNYTKNGDRIAIMGFTVVPTMQSKNTVIFGPANNLVLGFDTYSSHLEYKIVDMRQTTLDNTFRIGAISNIAVGVILPSLFTYSRVA